MDALEEENILSPFEAHLKCAQDLTSFLQDYSGGCVGQEWNDEFLDVVVVVPLMGAFLGDIWYCCWLVMVEPSELSGNQFFDEEFLANLFAFGNFLGKLFWLGPLMFVVTVYLFNITKKREIKII